VQRKTGAPSTARSKTSTRRARTRRRVRPGRPGEPECSRPVAPSRSAGRRSLAVSALTALLVTLNEQVKTLQGQVETHFGRHPDVEIILSQPGLGVILGARVLAEFGDARDRYATAKARKNYAATSPITRASGKKKTVTARFVHNDRLIDALMTQAFSALTASPGARAYYDRQRARGAGYNAALRQLANRLVGILHGSLKTRTLYDETTAWSHHLNTTAA
jgi:transposase